MPNVPGHNWYVALFVATGFILAWLKITGRAYIGTAVVSVFSIQKMRQSIRQGVLLANWHYFALGAVIVLSISAVTNYLLYPYQESLQINTPMAGYLASAVLLVVFFIRMLAIQIAGWVFRSPVLAYEHIYMSVMHAFTIGLIFLPLSWLILLGKWPIDLFLMQIIGLICLAGYIWKILRVLIQAVQTDLSYLHLILYLCTLEILPLVIMAKYFITKFGSLIEV